MALPPPDPTAAALVTGSSSGIGAHIARELAARGHGLILVARREDRLNALAHELARVHHVRAEVVACDLSDAHSRAALPKKIEDQGLLVDILVNNAGFTTMGAVWRANRNVELEMVRTNIEAVVDFCTTFAAGMVARHQGAILNTASTAAFQPLPGQACYGASKSFLLSYGQALGAELKGAGVTVTTLCPGPVTTEFAETAGLSDEEAAASLPRMMWIPVEQVARAAIDGLAAGHPVVIPGLANKIGALGGHLVPRSWLLPLVARRHPVLADPPR